MVGVSWVRFGAAGCGLLLTWLSALGCAAQHDAQETARSELARFSAAPRVRLEGATAPSPWLWVAAGTTAAFAAGFVTTETMQLKASDQRDSALERSRDLSLDLDTRTRARGQGFDAQMRADLLERVSNICLAGTVAATGATLLIWLTGKHKRRPDENKMLLGPMVLKGVRGGGLVLREKF